VPIEEFEPLPNCYYLLTSSESILTDPVLITWYPAKFRHHSIAKIATCLVTFTAWVYWQGRG